VVLVAGSWFLGAAFQGSKQPATRSEAKIPLYRESNKQPATSNNIK